VPTVEEGASSVFVLLAPKAVVDHPVETAPDEVAAALVQE